MIAMPQYTPTAVASGTTPGTKPAAPAAKPATPAAKPGDKPAAKTTKSATIKSAKSFADLMTKKRVAMKDAAAKKRDLYDEFLKKVPLLSSMDAYERSQVADALTRESYETGKQIVQEDDPGDKFFIIEEGEAYAEKKGAGKVMDYKVGDYFGELALLRNQPRAATVIAKSDLKVLVLPRIAFKRLLGPLDALLARGAEKY